MTAATVSSPRRSPRLLDITGEPRPRHDVPYTRVADRTDSTPATDTPHLVVEPKHHHDAGGLVPLSLVDSASEEIRLRCTVAEYDKLDRAEETHFLSDDDGYAGYGPGQALIWPYYGLGASGLGMGMWAGGATMGMGTAGGIERIDEPVSTDTVPAGEVAVYRGDQVHVTDGEIGHVRGLVVAPHNHHVTHILLQEGHFFGRKEVAIPISAVTGVIGGIQLDLTKDQVQELPPVDLANVPARIDGNH